MNACAKSQQIYLKSSMGSAMKSKLKKWQSERDNPNSYIIRIQHVSSKSFCILKGEAMTKPYGNEDLQFSRWLPHDRLRCLISMI